ncbi:MAG: hypothetical protein E6I24_00525, partial [Chloroflexi bacterium]
MVARPSMPRIWPRRALRSPRISPMNSSGMTTSTFMIGSSSAGWPLRMPSLAAIDPAMVNAISDESTSWYEPSTRVALTSTTGDTLADENNPIVLESIVFPEPVISVAIEPRTKVDQEKMGQALAKLAEEDPTFKVRTDEETAQTIISGMGELHLEIIVDRMLREFAVDANVGKPQVAYRETIKRKAHGVGRFVRQSGGRGQYGHAEIDMEPNEAGKGFEFVNKIVGGSIPKEYHSAVEKG